MLKKISQKIDQLLWHTNDPEVEILLLVGFIFALVVFFAWLVNQL